MNLWLLGGRSSPLLHVLPSPDPYLVIQKGFRHRNYFIALPGFDGIYILRSTTLVEPVVAFCDRMTSKEAKR